MGGKRVGVESKQNHPKEILRKRGICVGGVVGSGSSVLKFRIRVGI